jgi:hypothetical protein
LEWIHLSQAFNAAKDFNKFLLDVRGQTNKDWAREVNLTSLWGCSGFTQALVETRFSSPDHQQIVAATVRYNRGSCHLFMKLVAM